MLEFLLSIDAIFALITLTFLEIILGIDNIIFISIVANKLPRHQRSKATNIGLVRCYGAAHCFAVFCVISGRS